MVIKRLFSSVKLANGFLATILGAWWLGWIILGVVTLLFAGLIGLFPMHLPKKHKRMRKTSVNQYELASKESKITHEQNVAIADKQDVKGKDDEVNLKSKYTKKKNKQSVAESRLRHNECWQQKIDIQK